MAGRLILTDALLLDSGGTSFNPWVSEILTKQYCKWNGDTVLFCMLVFKQNCYANHLSFYYHSYYHSVCWISSYLTSLDTNNILTWTNETVYRGCPIIYILYAVLLIYSDYIYNKHQKCLWKKNVILKEAHYYEEFYLWIFTIFESYIGTFVAFDATIYCQNSSYQNKQHTMHFHVFYRDSLCKRSSQNGTVQMYQHGLKYITPYQGRYDKIR